MNQPLRLARGAALSCLILIGVAPGPLTRASWAQARLEGGGLTSISGPSASKTRALAGESGSNLSLDRSSSESADLIGGFVGGGFRSLATIGIETGEAEYASISFPLHPSNTTVVSVLDELGEPDPSTWRLGHWSPEDSAYVEAGEDLEEIERGEGYWLITETPVLVEETGLAAPIGDYEIDLEDGPGGRPAYNQLGNPFLFPIAVADLLVTNGSTTVPLASVENHLTEAAVKVYDAESGSYVTNPAVIEPRTAFWVKKLAAEPVTVVLPYQAATGVEEAPNLAKPAGAHWAVSVSARQGTKGCEPIVVGAAAVPAGTWNSLCLSRAPDPPGGGLSLSVHEGGWERLNGDYVRSFRATAATMSWEIAARGAVWPGELSLRFDALDLPAGAGMTFEDLLDGSTRSIDNGETFTIAARKDQRFRLTVTNEGRSGPARRFVDALSYVYPNPFRQRAGLTFTLAGGGAVEAKIHDVSGRRVRTLSASATTSGERVLVWDGRDGAGRVVAPGVYLVRYRVGHVTGVARLVKVG